MYLESGPDCNGTNGRCTRGSVPVSNDGQASGSYFQTAWPLAVLILVRHEASISFTTLSGIGT